MLSNLKETITALWENREDLNAATSQSHKQPILDVMKMINQGQYRVAEKQDDKWIVNEWLKQAILLYFKIMPMKAGQNHYDKIPLKFENWTENDFKQAGFRIVPPATIRYGAYLSKNTVAMPCYVNIGAFIDEGSMIDTWATIGSCAQIGRNVHISGGAGIGGVLEPLQATPVIIEDHCFIGARSEIAEGVIIGEGSVIAMGTFISASTKIINRETGEIHFGKVPAYSVIVPGTLPGKPLPDGSPGPNLACAIIVKQVDAKTRAKTSINELLRD